MRASLTAVVVLIATLSVVGCSQSTSPTVPSSGVTAPTSAQLGPGASYDATGSWHFVITDQRTGDLLDEGDGFLTQDTDGNLHATNGHTFFTFTRKGTGRIITYEMSIFEDHPQCDTTLSGPARLDTTNDSMQAQVSGTEEGCIKVSWSFTFTKNS